MIPDRRLIHRVTWITPGEKEDRYHNDADDWSEDAVTKVENMPAFIDQQSTIETVDGRDVAVTKLVMMTNELGIAKRHRIVWDDRTYFVDGDPAIAWTSEGAHHLESRLERVEG